MGKISKSKRNMQNSFTDKIMVAYIHLLKCMYISVFAILYELYWNKKNVESKDYSLFFL